MCGSAWGSVRLSGSARGSVRLSGSVAVQQCAVVRADVCGIARMCEAVHVAVRGSARIISVWHFYCGSVQLSSSLAVTGRQCAF
jgi:hypothetical protein